MTVESCVKKNSITRPDQPVKALPGDFIDNDVKRMLRPLRLIHFFSFCPYYRLKGNLILPNSLCSKLLSFCVTMFFMFLFAYRCYDHRYIRQQRRNVAFHTINSYVLVLISCFGVLSNFISALQSKLNVKFVLKIQDVHAFLNDSKVFKRFIYRNWIFVISIICYEVFGWISVNTLLKLSYMDVLCGAASMSFNVNIVNATRLIVLLQDKLNLWNDRVLQLEGMESNSDTEDYCQKLYQKYIDIMECYDIHKLSFQMKV
ncbi:hypothetical protein B5X24_HaOG200998, partial [Helicoverpa armigera]